MPQGRNLKYKTVKVRRSDVFDSISKHEILKKQIPPVTALRRNCWARGDSSCSFSERGRCPSLPFHSRQSLRYPRILCEHGFSTYQPVISPIPRDACTKATLQAPCIHTQGGGVQTVFTTPCCVDNQVCVGSDLVTWLCELPGFQGLHVTCILHGSGPHASAKCPAYTWDARQFLSRSLWALQACRNQVTSNAAPWHPAECLPRACSQQQRQLQHCSLRKAPPQLPKANPEPQNLESPGAQLSRPASQNDGTASPPEQDGASCFLGAGK